MIIESGRIEKMIDEKGYVKISKTGRNGYGVGTDNLTVTLPNDDIAYVKKWAEWHNVTVSRAVHNMVWMAYHAMKGDYKDYENGSK
jgi:hypothetical protein